MNTLCTIFCCNATTNLTILHINTQYNKKDSTMATTVTQIAVPAATAAKQTKIAPAPTTVVAAVKPKTVAVVAKPVAVAVITGGAAGHAGVGAVVGATDKTSTFVASPAYATKPKTVTTSPVVAATSNSHSVYR
jgi:hypothetical protein